MFDPMKAFINLPMWIRLASAITLAIVMFVWIGIGAEKAADRELPFLEVCWDSGGARYPENTKQREACPIPVVELKWDKPVKTVYWDMGPEYNAYRDSHKRAIQWVNDELGFVALVESQEEADITIVSGSYARGEGDMHTRHHKFDSKIRAIITVKAPRDIRSWMLEEQHELLHALGLAHKSTGIMSRSLAEPSDRQLIWSLRPNDRAALRKLLLPADL